MESKFSGQKLFIILSLVAALLAGVASAGGLLINNLYHDNEFVKTAWYGNDCVTLILVVPSLVLISLIFQHLVKARLVLIGLLAYLIYNYAFYLFGAAFNIFFLVYCAIFICSFFALITGLGFMATIEIQSSSFSIRWIAGYLILIAVMLCLIEFPPVIRFIIDGKIPEIIEKTNHPTGIVYALDFILIIPLMLLAAILMWKKKLWGFILAALMLIKAVTYGLVLTTGTILLAMKKINDPLLPVWIFITVGGLTGLIVLLKKITITEKKY